MRIRDLVIGLSAVLLMAVSIEGQVPAGPAQSAEADLEECSIAAGEEAKERMEVAAERLEAVAASIEAARPADALVIRARVRTQCYIPFSALMRQGQLVAESNELLERALALDPQHLVARFTLRAGPRR